MKGCFLMVLLSIFFPSCFPGRHKDHADLAYAIVGKNSSEVKKKYGFHTFGSGGCMRNGVQSVFISYSCECQVNVDQGRKLFVDIAEELIRKFNEDEEIRPFLGNYPFTFDNIELGLVFRYNEGGFIQGGYIASIKIVNGVICYSIYDPTKEGNPLRTVHREPYEEALKKVIEAGS